MPQFYNRENEKVMLENGREIWVSRAPAVVMVAIATCQGRHYVAMGERGPGAADFHGLWCVPCGYLDWDEDGAGGAMRETWEELGLDLTALPSHAVLASHLDHPWHVNTNPRENRQNVSLTYGVHFVVDELPPLTLGEQPGETSQSAWQPLEWVAANTGMTAFGHGVKVLNYAARLGLLTGEHAC